MAARQIGMVATKKGMLTALNPVLDGSNEVFAELAARIGRAVGELMARAVAAGVIRDDIDPADVIRAVIGMCYMREQPGWQETVIRLVDVFLDGLRRQDGAAKS